MATMSIFTILKILDEAKIHYRIDRDRPDTIRIDATFVGRRVEIECFEDGHVELSQFFGNEDIDGGINLLLSIINEA